MQLKLTVASMEEFYNLSIRLNDTPAAAATTAAAATAPIVTNFTLQLLNNSNESYESSNLYTQSLINTSLYQHPSVFITNVTTLLLTLLSTTVNHTLPVDSVNIIASAGVISPYTSSQYINTSHLVNVSNSKYSHVPSQRTNSQLNFLHSLHHVDNVTRESHLSSSLKSINIDAINLPDHVNIYASDQDESTIKYLPSDYADTGDHLSVNSSINSSTTALASSYSSSSLQSATAVDVHHRSPANLTYHAQDVHTNNDTESVSQSNSSLTKLMAAQNEKINLPLLINMTPGSVNLSHFASLKSTSNLTESNYVSRNDSDVTLVSASPIVEVQSAHPASNESSTLIAPSSSSSSSSSPLQHMAIKSTPVPATHESSTSMSGVIISVVNVRNSFSLDGKLTQNVSESVSLYNSSLLSSSSASVAASSSSTVSRWHSMNDETDETVRSAPSVKSAYHSSLLATVASYSSPVMAKEEEEEEDDDDGDKYNALATQEDMMNAVSAVNSSRREESQTDTQLTSPSREYWALLLTLLPILAIFGNTLVIISVYSEKSLRGVTNYFIVSLAFADLFVGAVVMPFAVYFLVSVHPS